MCISWVLNSVIICMRYLDPDYIVYHFIAMYVLNVGGLFVIASYMKAMAFKPYCLTLEHFIEINWIYFPLQTIQIHHILADFSISVPYFVFLSPIKSQPTLKTISLYGINSGKYFGCNKYIKKSTLTTTQFHR